jgi:hypothetical protein
MHKTAKRVATVGAVVAGAWALAAPIASATEQGGVSRTCNDSACSTPPTWFPGGTLSVDADVHGSGPAEWVVRGPGGVVCRTGFAAENGPASWVCRNVPAGELEAVVAGPAGPSNIGLRW